MDTTRRTVAKACTWQLSGLIVMTAITYLVTGSLVEGGAVAGGGALAGAIAYFAHEKVWNHVQWGRQR